MEEQLFTEGDVVTLKDQELVCSFVSWRERDGKKEKFTYSFRSKEEVEAEQRGAGLINEEQEA